MMDESALILRSFEDTPGAWRNVAPCVADALKSAIRTNMNTTQMIDSVTKRLSALEDKILDISATVSTFVENFSRVDSRLDAFHEQMHRGLKAVESRAQSFRDEYEEDVAKVNSEQRTAVTKLISHVRSLEAKLSTNIDVQDEVLHLSKDKVDNHTFTRAMDNLRVRLEELTLPQPFLYTAGGEAMIGAGGGLGGGAGAKNSSRWLWEGGSFSTMGRAIPWSKQISTSGKDVLWHPQSPGTIKIVRGGIYRISIGVFNDAADTSIPSVGVYIDNDAVVNATNCSTYMLKATSNKKSGKAISGNGKSSAGAKAARTACGCLPQCVNGLTVSDSFFIPPDAIVAIAYRADPRNVVQAFLEIEPFV